MADARFEFDTNIEQVRQRIQAGLNQIASDTARTQGQATPPVSATSFAASAAQTAASAQQSVVGIAKQFSEDINAGRRTSRDFAAQINSVAKDANNRILADMRTAIAGGLDPADARMQAQAAQRETRRAIEDIHNQVRQSILTSAQDAGVVGRGAKRLPDRHLGADALALGRLQHNFDQAMWRAVAQAERAERPAPAPYPPAAPAATKPPRASEAKPDPATTAAAATAASTAVSKQQFEEARRKEEAKRQAASSPPPAPSVVSTGVQQTKNDFQELLARLAPFSREDVGQAQVAQARDRIIKSLDREDGPDLPGAYREIEKLSQLQPEVLRGTPFETFEQARIAQKFDKDRQEQESAKEKARLKQESADKAERKRQVTEAQRHLRLLNDLERGVDQRRPENRQFFDELARQRQAAKAHLDFLNGLGEDQRWGENRDFYHELGQQARAARKNADFMRGVTEGDAKKVDSDRDTAARTAARDAERKAERAKRDAERKAERAKNEAERRADRARREAIAQRRSEETDARRINSLYDQGKADGRGREIYSPARALFGAPVRGSGPHGGAFTQRSMVGAFATTARYGVAGAAVYGLAAALGDTVREAMDYQDSMTAMENAVERFGDAQQQGIAVTNAYVNALSETTRVAGANVGQALDVALRGGRAFSADLGGSAAEMQSTGAAVAKYAGQLALITNTDITDSTGNIIAIGTAWGLAADQISQVNDAVANAKDLGGDPKQISQGLASSAGALQEAGFSLTEAASVISLVQARTDQSGLASATRLSRITQIMAGNNGRRALESVGIDTDQSARDQIVQLGQAWNGLTEAQQSNLKTALGGTSNLRELLPLLNDSEALLRSFDQGLQSAGRGQEEFEAKNADLVGALRELQGTLSNIQTGLFRSEVFLPLVAALDAVKEGLAVVDKFIQLWNRWPDYLGAAGEPLQKIVTLLIQAGIAYRLLATGPGIKVAEFALGGIGGTARGGATGRGAAMREAEGGRRSSRWPMASAAAIAAEIAAQGPVEGGGRRRRFYNTPFSELAREAINGRRMTEAEMVAGFGASDRRTRRGELLKNVTRPLRPGPLDSGILSSNIGGPLVVIGLLTAAVSALDTTNNAIKVFTDTTAHLGFQSGRSAQEIEDYGNNLRTQASLIRESTGGVFGSMVSYVTQSNDTAAAMDRVGASQQQLAQRIRDARQKEAQAKGPNDIDLDLSSAEALEADLSLLDESGRHAHTTFQALLGALREVGIEAGSAAKRLTGTDALEIGARVGGGFLENLTGAAQESRDQREGTPGRFGLLPFARRDDLMDSLEAQDIGVLQEQLTRQTRDFITENGGNLDNAGKQRLVELNKRFVQERWKDFAKLSEQDQARVMDAITLSTLTSIKDVVAAQSAGGADPEQAVKVAVPELIERARSDAQLTGLEVAAGFLIGKGSPEEAEARAFLKNIEDTEKAAKEALAREGKTLSIEEIERFHVARMEADAELAEIALNNSRARDAYSEALIPSDDLVALGQEAVNAATREVGRAKSTADRLKALANKARVVEAQRRTQIEAANARRSADVDPLSTRDQLAADLANVRDLMSDTTQFGADGLETSAYAALREQEKQIIARQNDNARATLAARERAGIDPRNSLGNAEQDLRDAQIAVNALTESQDGYWEAQRDLLAAQIELVNKQMEYAHNLRLLAIDMTDPVAVAEEETRTAYETWQRLIREQAGPAEIAQAEVDFRQSQAAQEQTAFDTQMNLMRRRKELGDISFSAYMGYLRAEEARLQAIADRTFQQEDQLMTIREAIKAAGESLNGMFNLGDIRVPTPYEVRRAMAERNAGYGGPATFGASASPVANNIVSTDVQVNINGGDTTQLMAVLERYLGPIAAGQYAVGASRRGF